MAYTESDFLVPWIIDDLPGGNNAATVFDINYNSLSANIALVANLIDGVNDIANNSANTVAVSANSGSTLTEQQLNFINTSTVLVTVDAGTGSAAGNANISFTSTTPPLYHNGSDTTLNPTFLNFNDTASIGVIITQDAATSGANISFTSLQSAQGAQGIQGIQGIQGRDGGQGSVGYSGSPGAQGYIGYQGSTGSGSPGAQGAQGYQGPAGSGGSLAITNTYVAYGTGSGITGSSGLTYSGGNLTCGGNMYASDFIIPSDARLKNVVGKIDSPLESLKSLNGVKYYWNDEAKEMGITDESLQVGLLAQEIEKILPEAVNDINGKLNVAYDRIIPLLVEAIKELSRKIDKDF